MQIVTGSDRDNTTVLAAVSASGAVLPPLIIFQGKQVQTKWRPSTAANHQCYPWIYANEKGWMKSDIFSKWFCEWESRTRIITEARNLEPRPMIYNGHLSHLNYDTIKHVRINNVTILKLLPLTTDLLQPLDVSVFKSLKDKWRDVLFKRLKNKRTTLTKAKFSTLLSNDDVWRDAFNLNSIQNGFHK